MRKPEHAFGEKMTLFWHNHFTSELPTCLRCPVLLQAKSALSWLCFWKLQGAFKQDHHKSMYACLSRSVAECGR